MKSLLRTIIVAAALWQAHGVASAQTWGFVANTLPSGVTPLAFASVTVGDADKGWRLVAWCERAVADKMRWEIRVQTKGIISAYRSTDVLMRFDDRKPSKISASLAGDYSNFAVLAQSESSDATALHSWLSDLKTSQHLSIQIGNVERVFSMNGSTSALTNWVNHCSLA